MTLEQQVRAFYRRLFRDRLSILRAELGDCRTAVDLGCGQSSPLPFCGVPYAVGVDVYRGYFEDSGRRAHGHSAYIEADVRRVEFRERSIDAVLALEVVEHLPKQDGWALIERMERWARRKVIISTPNGFVPQRPDDKNVHQEHLSGWLPEEFTARGYRVCGFSGWKRLRDDDSQLKYRPEFVWQRVVDITQLITYRLPRLAFQFYAVKECAR
jgi:Methyltransferase domain